MNYKALLFAAGFTAIWLASSGYPTTASAAVPAKVPAVTAVPASANCLAREFIDWSTSDDVLAWLNEYNRTTSLTQVHERDRNWPQYNDNDPAIKAVQQHPAAAALRALQNHYAVLGESFLIGANGGLVAATNRTSDYWQADEAQFTEAVKLARGSYKIIKPTVDESSQAILAKMIIPVRARESDRVIGVLVLGFDQLVVDFERPCAR